MLTAALVAGGVVLVVVLALSITAHVADRRWERWQEQQEIARQQSEWRARSERNRQRGA